MPVNYYLDLRQGGAAQIAEHELTIYRRLARIIRALAFVAVESAQSGHPGSSSKTEELLALTLGQPFRFDPMRPKHPGRDRLVWSAGHSTPLLHATTALYYECLSRAGRQFSNAVTNAILPLDLINFRHPHGPPGHAEGQYPLSDFSTGPSGHGLSAAGGMAIAHKSAGLDTTVHVMMGDAESEEGMTYEARNVLAATGMDNMVVTLDYNHFGIDGPIEQVISSPYVNHWQGLGWNVIETDGHNIEQMISGYLAAKEKRNGCPTVIISHTLKGKEYGRAENTAKSHGTAATHEEYVEIIKQLGFDIPGKLGDTAKDIETILEAITPEDVTFVTARLEEAAALIPTEQASIKTMEAALTGRPMLSPKDIKRPKKLPPELSFRAGSKVATRQAAGAFLSWLMKQSAFFYTGAGDVAGSIGTKDSESIFGIISPDNPYGRGIRFGIAEQNLAMMSAGLSADILPGGFRPATATGTFAEFTLLSSNATRLAAINHFLNPKSRGFMVTIASHDGPETGEDGPTHQGLYWSAIYSNLPGIKVWKPADANETIEILFNALENNEPIVLSLSRPATPVFKRPSGATALATNLGAYVYKNYSPWSRKPKLCLVVSSGTVLANTAMALEELEKEYNPKIVYASSPQTFAKLRQADPKTASKIVSDQDRTHCVSIHNGWPDFLLPVTLPMEQMKRTLGTDTYYPAGTGEEVVSAAKLDMSGIIERVRRAVK